MFYNFRGPNVKFENDDIINRINCYCHLLNNLVEYMCAIEPVKQLVSDVSSLVSFIRNSGLNEMCDPKLKKYVDSRWNTVVNLFASVGLNYTKLGHILLEKEKADKSSDVVPKLLICPRNDIDIIATFLKRFKLWSERLEADKKPTLWMVWPTLTLMRMHLEAKPTDHMIIKQMKEAGRLYLEKNEFDSAPKLVHQMSTVLHPVIKNIALATEQEKKEVYGQIDDAIYISEPFHETRDANLNEAVAVHENLDILEAFVGVVNVNSPPQSQETYTDKLERYLQLRLPLFDPHEFDLCEWWHRNRHTFPKLYKLFLSLAGVTASSAPSERKFSETGIFLTARRSNTLPETLSDLVLARNHLMNFL